MKEGECRICGNEKNNSVYKVKEMMLGLREEFEYFQCSICRCLQIGSVPGNLDKYYPDGYYSYSSTAAGKSGIKRWLIAKRDIFLLSGKGLTGRLLSIPFPDESISSFKGVARSARLLDVGCGSGELLFRLKECGYDNILGIDPYNADDIRYDNGLIIKKLSIGEVDGKWDLITFHHSLEHIADQKETLRKVKSLLSETGKCIIRMPVVDTFAWEHYREKWVQLDAPRHLNLHSLRSISLLAESTGLEVDQVEFNSTGFQFWGSEQYLQDIPLTDIRSLSSGMTRSIFNRKQIGRFEKRARELNHEGRGDQAIFILKKH